ncbi:MAG: hypothetical protein HQM00_15045, partial [Magnetococcales bacterium]|nr:hypothetical protein [Magnetococcales bacterium]
ITGTLTSADAEGSTRTYGLTDASSTSVTFEGVSYDLSKTGTLGTLYLNSTTGDYRFEPGALNTLSANTEENFILSVTDGSLSTPADLAVSVTAANDTPTLTTPTPISYTDTAENDSFAPITGTLTSADAEGSTRTYGLTDASSTSVTFEGVSYDLSKTGTLGTLYLNSTTGDYRFEPGDLNALSTDALENFVLSITADTLVSTTNLAVSISATNETLPLTFTALEEIQFEDTSSTDNFTNHSGTLLTTGGHQTSRTFNIPNGTVLENNPDFDRIKSLDQGTFYLNSTTGAYQFVPNDLNILATDLTESLILTVTDGSQSATTTLQISTHGVDDAATVTAGAPNATLVESGGQNDTNAGTDSSELTIHWDDPEDSTGFDTTWLVANGWSTTDQGVTYTHAGIYGSATLTVATGTLRYTLDNTSSATQSLTAGQVVTERFTLQIKDDNNSQSVDGTFTIQGNNDTPVAQDDSATATEAGGVANGTPGTLATGNALDNDASIDGSQTHTIAAIRTGDSNGSGTAGTVGNALTGHYGTLTILSDGTYSYTINDTLAEVQMLRGADQTLTDTFTYTMQDANGLTDQAQITITVEGRNDAPSLTNTLAAVTWQGSGAKSHQISADSFQDPDQGETLTYSLQLSDQSPLPTWLSWNPDSRTLSATPPQGTRSYDLIITATDLAGAATQGTLSLTISNPVTPPSTPTTTTGGTGSSSATSTTTTSTGGGTSGSASQAQVVTFSSGDNLNMGGATGTAPVVTFASSSSTNSSTIPDSNSGSGSATGSSSSLLNNSPLSSAGCRHHDICHSPLLSVRHQQHDGKNHDHKFHHHRLHHHDGHNRFADHHRYFVHAEQHQRSDAHGHRRRQLPGGGCQPPKWRNWSVPGGKSAGSGGRVGRESGVQHSFHHLCPHRCPGNRLLDRLPSQWLHSARMAELQSANR